MSEQFLDLAFISSKISRDLNAFELEPPLIMSQILKPKLACFTLRK